MSASGYSMGGQIGAGFGGGGYDTGSSLGSGGNGAGGNGGGDDGLVFDVTTQAFMQDVIEASKSQPVIVDFWAPWCGPCKQLTPVIEGAVRAARGAVKLAKMNIDEHPEVAGQMGVQSIPAVVAFKDGQPVDGFMGAQPDSQVKAFIEKLGGAAPEDPAEAYLEQGDALLADKNYAQAAQMFGAVMQADQENLRALSGLGHCYVGADELERARQLLEMVPEDKADDQGVQSFKAALELAEQAAAVGDLGPLMAQVESNPDDHQARFDLALGLAGMGNKEGAVDQLIEIFRRDREWNEDGARKQLLQFFEAWGFKDPASNYGRRKLSAALFA